MLWFFQPCENIWSLCFAKDTVTTVKPRFHGNQRMIHLLIPSLPASLLTGLSEFHAVKFRYFLCKEERNSKVPPFKVKQILYIRLANFSNFRFCHLLQLSMYNSP